MGKPAKTAALLFGLGVGATVGPSLGPAAVWSGAAIAVLGVALSLVGSTESNLVEDNRADRTEDAGTAGDEATAGTAVTVERRRGNRQRPALKGLGTRVEQILNLAEEQAAAHVTAAQREAEAILDRAHREAAGITGTRRDLSPAPPTRTPSPDGPSPHA